MTYVDTILHGAQFCAVTVLLSLAAAPAVGQTAGEGQSSPLNHWRVDLAVGDVNWRSLPVAAGDGAWQPVQSGAILAPPAEIETSADARVELRRGEDWIQAGADTRLTLEDSPSDLITLIRQAAGAVWYSVKSIAGRKFEVEGRYLVATVKGTEFLIMLGSQGDLLRVKEGVVRATPSGGGEGLDVVAGQAVLANASGLLLIAPPPSPTPLELTPPPVAPLEQMSPSGGESEPTGSAPQPAPQEPPPPTPDPDEPPTPGPGEPPTPDPDGPPTPPGPGELPGNGNATGDAHGVNSEEKHNHGGEKGAGVSDSHGGAKSDHGGDNGNPGSNNGNQGGGNGNQGGGNGKGPN